MTVPIPGEVFLTSRLFPLLQFKLIISLLSIADMESILLPSSLQFYFVPSLRCIPLVCLHLYETIPVCSILSHRSYFLDFWSCPLLSKSSPPRVYILLEVWLRNSEGYTPPETAPAASREYFWCNMQDTAQLACRKQFQYYISDMIVRLSNYRQASR